MNIIYKTSNTNLMQKLTNSEYKVLFSLVGLADNNIVDMVMLETRVCLDTGLEPKTIKNTIYGLVKKNVLIKTYVKRVYFIEPSIFMIGYEKKIYKYASMLNDSHLMEEIRKDKALERKDYEIKILESSFETKRLEQNTFEKKEEELNKIEEKNLQDN